MLAESYERIHRSNLVGMGVLPLQFKPGDSAEKLGLAGQETFDIEIRNDQGVVTPMANVAVKATAPDGTVKAFTMTSRIDTPVEADYYRNGGILQTVLRAFR